MNTRYQSKHPGVLGAIAAALICVAAYSGMAFGDQVRVILSGEFEVPAVKSKASGDGTITINADKSVSGSVTTKAVAGTGAHIHMGPLGKNGPVAVTLDKSGANKWSIKAGTKLTDEQYKAYKAGNLYVNVHSAENKGGEIRGQLTP
jgi:hypothetical protein